MFKGISTFEAFEQCVKRGLCENHIKEINQNELAVQLDELPRKTFLFIRVNILYTILFKKSTKCERIKILLQKTPIFSRILAKGDTSEAADVLLTLDSVVIFTLCHFSKICCIGAIFQKNNIMSEDPEIKLLQQWLFVDHFDESILYHLFPLLQKNFTGFDMDLIKVSFIITLLFVKDYCIKLNIKKAIQVMEEEFECSPQWENYKTIGDNLLQKENYKDACNTYTTAALLYSYSSELFTQRAYTYLKLGKFKAAQLDAYIAVAINPKWCEGYYVFCTSIFHQKQYQEAFNISKYGLEVCESNAPFYESLQAFHIDIERKYLNKELLNNISENSINQDSANKSLPEKKYFPVLVDSDSADSESEACQETLPELVDASDSEESEHTEKKIKLTPTKNKTKKKRIVPENSSVDEVIQMDMPKIRTYLKEASEAILSDCGYKAVQIFRGPLRDFIDSPKLNTFEECEIVCIKYAYAIAYCKSGGYDDLLKCIAILKEIIEKHDSVTFPAAYYALGLTYRKLNRFKEALCYLETVQNFLCKGIHFKVYPWPEILTVIQETKPDILKVLVSDLIKECESPPNADALCRYINCSFQPTIYYSDPDFKGYISLFCSEQCCLQYHLQCWKTIKAEKNLTDKEFLEEGCFTPDCEGLIIKVQNIDKKGNLTKEFISDFKKTGKQKWAKWEKKTDLKEKKKKRANSKVEDGLEVSSENGKASSRKNSETNDKFILVQISDTVTPPVEKDTASFEHALLSSQSIPLQLNVGSKSNDICSSTANCGQEMKDTTNSFGKSESRNFQKTANCPSSEEGKGINNLKTPGVAAAFDEDKVSKSLQETISTSHFQNDSKIIRKEMQENSSQYMVSECIKSNTYSFMYDLLQHHGPLKIDDPLVISELSSFPIEVNTMISQCGGIGEFLKNDLRFAFVGDVYICIISDLAKAYRMNSNSLQTDLGSFQSLESTNNPELLNEGDENAKLHNFGLNPDAVEYTPVDLSLNGQNNDHRTYENSLDKNLLFSYSTCKNESSHLLSTTDANSESQNDKSESCNSAINVKLNNDSDFISGQTKVNGSEELSNKVTSESKLNLETQNLDYDVNAVNYNQNFIEDNENLCIDPNNTKEETEDYSRFKKIIKLLPALKEFCDKDFDKYHEYIDIHIKPYSIRKLTKTATTGTKMDLESTGENTNSINQLKCVTDSLKAENKKLEEENLCLESNLSAAVTEIKKLREEVSRLSSQLSSSSFDLEVLKVEYKKKEEALQNGREFLIKSLTQAHSTIDERKKRIELLEGLNSRLEDTVDKLTSSVTEAEEKIKNAVKAEEKKHVDIIKNLQKENDELKNRLKCAEVQFLQTKKAEFLKRIEDKFLDVSTRKQELTRGLSMISGNLNPVVQSSMKTIFSQFSSYEDELKTLKLEFVNNIDTQIEKVEKGTPLKDLKDIEIKKIPDPPHLQGLLPESDQSFLNSSKMPCNIFNMSSWPQMLSTPIIPKVTTSATNIPSSTIIHPANPLATVIKPSLSSVIPTTKLATAVIPQATPSATIIPKAIPSTKVIQSSTCAAAEPSHITHSVLASVIPDIGTNQKKPYDILDSKIQEPLKSAGTSMNTFSSIPYTVPTLDKEFNKTCAIFRPPDSLSNNKSGNVKVPPGITSCAANLTSSRTTLSSSKDSLETFPVGEGAFGNANFTSSVNKPVMNASGQKKSVLTQGKVGYDKLLQKLKEQFPSYSQEELISLLKEFRSKRQGKLSGLTIDAIVSALKTIIKSKEEAEKKSNELKTQTKVNKVLVNKKLVVDSKVSALPEQQQSVKKKSAWGIVDSDCKTFSANPDDDCIICCDPMTPTSAYKVACGHNFHERCIRQWLKNKSNCPVCRVLLLLPEEYPSLS